MTDTERSYYHFSYCDGYIQFIPSIPVNCYKQLSIPTHTNSHLLYCCKCSELFHVSDHDDPLLSSNLTSYMEDMDKVLDLDTRFSTNLNNNTYKLNNMEEIWRENNMEVIDRLNNLEKRFTGDSIEELRQRLLTGVNLENQ